VVKGRNKKKLRDANRNRLGRSRLSSLTVVAIGELRKELSLIDKTIEALVRLSRLRGTSG
jgi:hypothetical protein